MRRVLLLLVVFFSALLLVGPLNDVWAFSSNNRICLNVVVGYPWKGPCKGYAVKAMEVRYKGMSFRMRGDGSLISVPQGVKISRDGCGRVKNVNIKGRVLTLGYYGPRGGQIYRIESTDAGTVYFSYNGNRTLYRITYDKVVYVDYRGGVRKEFTGFNGKIPCYRLEFRE